MRDNSKKKHRKQGNRQPAGAATWAQRVANRAMHTLQNIVYLRNYGIDRQSVLWKLTGVRGWPHVTQRDCGHEAQEAAAVGEDLLKNGKLQPTI